MKVLSGTILIALLLGVVSMVYAASAVIGEVKPYIVTVDANGEEDIKPSIGPVSGQIIEYRIVFKNTGDSSVSGITVVDPIPPNTLFIADSHDSDVGAYFEVSIDDGKSFDTIPVKRMEKQPGGGEVALIVSPENYTHVRWVTSEKLDSNGGEHNYRYRVTVK